MHKNAIHLQFFALLNLGLAVTTVKAQNVDAITEDQAGNLIENQKVDLTDDGNTLLVPQISEHDLDGKIPNHISYDNNNNRYLTLGGWPPIKLDRNQYIKLSNGSMVNAGSLACPLSLYNGNVIFRNYRMGLAFPSGWRIVVQTSDKLLIVTGPFSLAPQFQFDSMDDHLIGTRREDADTLIGNELDSGMLIQSIGAFRVGSKWDELFDDLKKAGLVLDQKNTETHFKWCEIKLEPPSPLLKDYFDALYANANLQVAASTEGKCYKDLLFGDSPSQVLAKTSQYKDLSPLVPKSLGRYGLQFNDIDLAYAGYFAGLPVIIKCMFMPGGTGNLSLTAISFTHLIGGYNTDATAVATAFGLQDAETKAKWESLLGDSQAAFNTSMNALSDFLKTSQELEQRRLQSRDVVEKFEQALLGAGYMGTKQAFDGSVSYMSSRKINANLTFNDNLVSVQLTDLRRFYQATLNESIEAFKKADRALSDETTSNAEAINNTVNDLDGVSAPASLATTANGNTTPFSIPSNPASHIVPPVDTSQPSGSVSSSLASKIIGSWQGPRHTETYLADGRYGLDVDTTGQYYGHWSISGNTLKTTYPGVNVETVCTDVAITDTDLGFVSNGHRFTYHRVNDLPVPGH